MEIIGALKLVYREKKSFVGKTNLFIGRKQTDYVVIHVRQKITQESEWRIQNSSTKNRHIQKTQ